MAEPTLCPSSRLTLKNPTPPPGTQAPADRFILFSDSWLQLQSFVAQMLSLPINKGEFEQKYGTFSDEALITGCLDAMKTLQGLSATFGDPTTIKQKIAHDGSYLTSATPPDTIYGHIVWLANQIENAAATFNYTLKELQPLLSPSVGSKQDRADNLTMILTGQGGLLTTANDMKTKVSALSQTLAGFDKSVADASTGMSQYTSSQSEILKALNDLIGQYASDIHTLQGDADDAYKKWRDYTIAAVTTSVGVLILTAGMLWPVAAGLGIGLGVAASKQLAAYNNLTKKIKQDQAEKALKVRLVTDLTGLNATIPGAANALTTFRTALSEIEGVWTDIGGNLSHIISNYTVDQLSNYAWVVQAMKIGAATAAWKGIAETASDFTQHSLVSYSTDVPFGEPIPNAA